jgi:hypothetical protein
MYAKFVNCAVLLAFLAAAALAQSQSSPGSAQPAAAPAQSQASDSVDQPVAPNQPYRPIRAPRTVLCWKQAGISPDQVNQRWHIEDRGKGRIAGVCSDPSTSAEQKSAKIDQINRETDQEVANLIPPKQLQAFKSCQAELEKRRPAKTGEKELGPCGGVIPPTASSATDHSQH